MVDFPVGPGERKWRCVKCGWTLGVVDETGEQLRMKVGNVIYCYVKGGSVTITCKRCAQLNELNQASDAIPSEGAVASQGGTGHGV